MPTKVGSAVRFLSYRRAPLQTFKTWEELKVAIGWVEDDHEANAIRLRTINEYFEDSRRLLIASFSKIGVVSAVYGIVTTFGANDVNKDGQHSVSSLLTLVSMIIATMSALVALAPSIRIVFRRQRDSGLVALSTRSPEEEAWGKYEWQLHAERTRIRVDRGLWASVWLGVVALSVFLWELIPWSASYHAVLG